MMLKQVMMYICLNDADEVGKMPVLATSTLEVCFIVPCVTPKVVRVWYQFGLPVPVLERPPLCAQYVSKEKEM